MGQTIATEGDPSRNHPATALGAFSPTTAAAYGPLTPLCLRSLADSYDDRRHLFSHQLLDGAWTEVDATYPHETLTSSCIALIGLARFGALADHPTVSAQRCLDAIRGEVRRTGYQAGIGLALWANAVADGAAPAAEYLGGIGLDFDDLVERLLPSFTTMEVAWLASGLLHEAARSDEPDVRDTARLVVDELRTHRYSGATRLMRHAGPGASPVHRARGHIANFADQIYSVQAFAFASLVLGDAAALGAGTALASHHCDLQGELGQWWWHFDARRGHVALRYAVYSVHQHGMAPMALAAIHRAGGLDVSAHVDASVGWLDHNELGSSLVDASRSTIWRSVERVEASLAGRLRGGLEALGVPDARAARVSLNRETRPYEWAWCLYAAAIAAGTPRGRSLV